MILILAMILASFKMHSRQYLKLFSPDSVVFLPFVPFAAASINRMKLWTFWPNPTHAGKG